MKKHYLWLFAVFLFLSCSQPKASNSANVRTNIVTSQPANNSNDNSNLIMPPANQNKTPSANSSESLELMRQIENQQRETANQSTTSNKPVTTKTPPPPKAGNPQRQTF